MYRIERLVPLIGATVAGPLGVVHLPRMWLKSVLSAAGMLYDGYFDNDKGFNHQVVEGLGLDPEPWFAFLATMPTYPAAEAYVRAHATSADAASIAALNARVLAYLRPEENAAAVRLRAGIDAPDLRLSAFLLNFDDWCTVNEQLRAHRTEGIEPIVPMVSSSQTGLLGIPHLPRMWIKASLAAVRALPAEWKTGPSCGFDNALATTVGFDLAAACAFISSELPSYVEFERWVSERIGQPDAATKAQWMAKLLGLQKSAETAAADYAEAKMPGPALQSAILLNDLVDWRHMHDAAVAGAATKPAA